MPRRTTLYRIASGLGVPESEILGEWVVPPQNPVDGAIVDVSVLGVKLAYPDA
jgi:hypothetical protein